MSILNKYLYVEYILGEYIPSLLFKAKFFQITEICPLKLFKISSPYLCSIHTIENPDGWSTLLLYPVQLHSCSQLAFISPHNASHSV